jgi:hypothetical protein
VSTQDWYDDEPVTVADALALSAWQRDVARAAERWARVRRDSSATRATMRAAEDALLRAVESDR